MNRKELKQKRGQIADRTDKSQKLAEQLLPFLPPEYKIGIYIPIGSEADIYTPLQNKGFKLYAPKVLSRTEMKFYPADHLEPGVWGILEPEAEHEEVPDILLIPMLGYDQNIRIGYGGGYYDRYLSMHPEVLKIGIAFTQQKTHLERQPWDVLMDWVATEQGITFYQYEPLNSVSSGQTAK